MNAVDVVLLLTVVILTLVVVGAVLFGMRVLRRLSAAPAPEDPAFVAEKDRQEQSLAALRTAADEANSTIDVAKSAASAARAEAAAAKAEAKAARAEAGRVLDTARIEADTILERAHKQAEADAEQLRTTARRSGEREVAGGGDLLPQHRRPRRPARRAAGATDRRPFSRP
ncbi:hypothetical protein ABT336_23990, partial [Micromonospora sp. NPDC000207]